MTFALARGLIEADADSALELGANPLRDPDRRVDIASSPTERLNTVLHRLAFVMVAHLWTEMTCSNGLVRAIAAR